MAEESQSLSDLSELGEATGAVAPEPEDSNEPKLDAQGRAYATGKRKNAVARVWIKPGSGRISVNGRDVETPRSAQALTVSAVPSSEPSATTRICRRSRG